MVLAARSPAVYARLLSGNLLETMSEDHIRAARAKGLRRAGSCSSTACALAITPS